MCTSLLNMYIQLHLPFHPSAIKNNVGTFVVSIACRSHQRIDDTPMFTPTHKYNVWEDDRHSTGATPRFSKGKRRFLVHPGKHFLLTINFENICRLAIVDM